MNKTDWKGDLNIKWILRSYVLIALPVIVLFLFINLFLDSRELAKNKELLIEVEKQHLKSLSISIEEVFNDLNSTISFLKNSGEFTAYLNSSTPKNFYEVEQLLLRFQSSTKEFDWIELINQAGMETIRVDYSNGITTLVSPELLQSKKNSSYFQDTIKLDKMSIYVSPMDLNIERDVIEYPLKPVIRIATPLYNKWNVFKGILVLNYLCEDILNEFSHQLGDQDYGFIDTSLINDDGYYLYSSNSDYTFGFMFEGGDYNNVSHDNPEFWKLINSANSGSFEKDGVVSIFLKIYPLKNIRAMDSNKYSWVIISSFNAKHLPFTQRNFLFGVKLVDILILAGICILLFVFIVLYYYYIKSRSELDIAIRIATETNDAVVITDSKTRITYVNKSFEKITGYTQSEVLGLKTSHFKSGKQSESFYKDMWDSINTTGYWHGELWDRKKDKILYPKKLSIFAVYKKSSNFVEKYIGVFSDLTAIKEVQKSATLFKNYNPETNLPNENLLKVLIDKSIKSTDKKLTVICFSITNFSTLLLSESHNQQQLINNFITSIKSILAPDDFIAQISKSLFVLGICSSDVGVDVDKFLTKFLTNSQQSYNVNDKMLFFDIKSGISVYPDNSKTASELINNAYIALEHIRKQKGTSYLYYSSDLKRELKEKERMNQLLRSAIINNELSVYYQPQVDSTNNKIVGAEALMRWNSPELGTVSPAVFIPIAESSGLITDIGYWLIGQVFKDISEIKRLFSPEFTVSINISPLQFKDNNLVSEFTRKSEEYDLDLDNFEIEITESIFVDDINVINDKLAEFKSLGVSVALDDFGTGFSSLSYLKGLKVDKIKIDRSFIKDYPHADKGEMARVITNITKALNLKVITEGAETKEHVDYLKSIGCNCIQGYYYSRPLPLNDFIVYVEDH